MKDSHFRSGMIVLELGGGEVVCPTRHDKYGGKSVGLKFQPSPLTVLESFEVASPKGKPLPTPKSGTSLVRLGIWRSLGEGGSESALLPR